VWLQLQPNFFHTTEKMGVVHPYNDDNWLEVVAASSKVAILGVR
jgi:hypothetical protein